MLGLKDALGQHIRRVVRQHGHRRLRDDGAFIHLGTDEMHRGAREAHACIDCALMHMQALEGGQERGVDVEHPVAPPVDEIVGQDAHEARIADEFDLRIFQRAVKHRVELLARLEFLVVDDLVGDTGFLGMEEAGRIRPVGQH